MKNILILCFPLFFSLSLLAQDYHVAAYYYPWYAKRHWKQGYWRENLQPPQKPLLGEYKSRNKKVIRQHLSWSAEYGINSWICSWWGRGKPTDNVLKKHVLPELEETDLKMCLFYESAGILGMKNGYTNLDDRNIKQLEKDIRYIAQQYFHSDNYLKINGRPVLFLYLTRTFKGQVRFAFEKIRAAAKEEGYDIYLVGDEVFWQRPNPQMLRLLDAVTPYNMHGPRQYDGYAGQTGFLEGVKKQYALYEYVAKKEGCAFIPNAFPGFNDQGVRPEARHYAIPPKLTPDDEMGSTFLSYLQLAASFTDEDLRMLTITSFNEWHEDTQIEPSIQNEEKQSPQNPAPYKAYEFTYLELLKAILSTE